MAKGKDTKAGKDTNERSTTSSARGAGMKTPGSRPAQPRKETRVSPDTPPLGGGNAAAKPSAEEVYRMIQESAYFKAKARGFAPGHEVQDWIEAEAEVRRRLEVRT